MSEWISVKDALPEIIHKDIKNPQSLEVIVFNGEISVGVRWICGENEYFESNEYDKRYNLITHWMPLPTPPEE